MFYNPALLLKKEIGICENYVKKEELPMENVLTADTKLLGTYDSVFGKINNIALITEILQAYQRGKEIECYTACAGYDKNWHRACDSEIKELLISMPHAFRIKEEAQYRPYKNSKEYIEASREHGPYFHTPDENSCYFFASAVEGEELTVREHMAGEINFQHLYKHYVWQDGSKCGILIKK